MELQLRVAALCFFQLPAMVISHSRRTSPCDHVSSFFFEKSFINVPFSKANYANCAITGGYFWQNMPYSVACLHLREPHSVIGDGHFIS